MRVSIWSPDLSKRLYLGDDKTMTNGNNIKNKISISIVSHGHCKMLTKLLMEIGGLTSSISHVFVTHNIASELILDVTSFPFQTTIIRNEFPLGFGANHNQAFKLCVTDYFCILNPDVEFVEDPFIELINFIEDDTVGVVAPTVCNKDGFTEDSYRKFPTPISICKKVFFGEKGMYTSSTEISAVNPDWVAGMFMLLKSATYEDLGGFDEKYFLYYEDIDLCLRSWRSNRSVVVSKNVSIIHNAQRDSHNNLRFLLLHLKSMCRFFFNYWFRFPR